jgi:hypothetical protein
LGCPFHTRCPEYIGGECETEVPALEAVDGEGGVHRAACHWNDRDEVERRQQSPYDGDAGGP